MTRLFRAVIAPALAIVTLVVLINTMSERQFAFQLAGWRRGATAYAAVVPSVDVTHVPGFGGPRDLVQPVELTVQSETLSNPFARERNPPSVRSTAH